MDWKLSVEQRAWLHDRCAIAALTGMLSDGQAWNEELAAVAAYNFADAMLAERDRREAAKARKRR